MLEPPPLTDQQIIAALCAPYGLDVQKILFLPVGNDATAWSFRVDIAGGEARFLKVRLGTPDAPALDVPHYLREQGITEVVAALPAASRVLWQPLDRYALVLYPYVEGRTGAAVGLTDAQWVRLGEVLRAIHATILPETLAAQTRRETGIPWWSDTVCKVNDVVARGDFTEGAACDLAAFWRDRRAEIVRIVARAETLGRRMQAQKEPFVLCHADIHTANVLVTEDGGLAIVDWDGVVMAPKERDLMHVVDRAQDAGDRSWQERRFLDGYGPVAISPTALAYYRYEWVVQELGDYAARVFFTDGLGAETRADAVQGLHALFDPGDVVDAAYASEQHCPEP